MVSKLKRTFRKKGVRFYLNSVYPLILNSRVRNVSRKDKIEVVFFACNVAMWHYQDVYDLLSKESRFNCSIVLSVFTTISKNQQVTDLKEMRAYLDERGMKYYDYDVENGVGYDVLNELNPDLVFHPQPYYEAFPPIHSPQRFLKCLLCYVPYGISAVSNSTNDGVYYDLPYLNLAWKLYYPFKYDKERAKGAKNHGRNVVVVGYPNTDRYLDGKNVDVWKIKAPGVKRLIWAPHFTIRSEISWLARSNFLWMAQPMLDLANKHKGSLQIAFKPHPRLKTELYKHPDWGKEKTDAYYRMWEDGENIQLETGDFVDLFKSSDAMIHDSDSFTAEYLFVNKPVAFVTRDYDHLKKEHSEFGQAALEQHYIVTNQDEMTAFVENVVLAGQDSKSEQRSSFVQTVLMPNATGTTSQCIVADLKKSLSIS